MAVMLGEGSSDPLLRHVRKHGSGLVGWPHDTVIAKVDVLRPGSFASTADLVDLIPAER
jgi:hypothetical protein